MQRQTSVSIWCEYLIEAGWLLILTLIPIYFNLFSARHFEPDKATTLRAIVVFMAAFALIRALELFRVNAGQQSRTTKPPTEEPVATNPLGGLGQAFKRLNNIPLAVPVLIYALVFILTTITSVVPYTSFWGSYQRLQGTYTNLSYIALFVLILLTLRRREQLERIITISLITGLVVSFYGFVQHFGLDPLPWQGDVERRVASTMGNAIFVAAYLIMIVPLALYRLVSGITEAFRERNPEPVSPWLSVAWGLAYGLMVIGTMMLMVASIKFGAEAGAFLGSGYWWVFPGAIIIATGLWTIPTLNIPYSRGRSLPLVPMLLPAALLILYTLMLIQAISFSLSPPPEVKNQLDQLTSGPPWWLWFLGGIVLIGLFYASLFVLPRQTPPPSRTFHILRAVGALIVLASLLTTIFFSGSRGPWLGLFAGLFVFITLLLWLGGQRTKQGPIVWLRRGLQVAFWGWIALALAGGGFLVAFNVLDTPFFDKLRENRYLNRLGSLTEAGSGTGLVRRLIWFGDEHGGGTVEMVTDRPLRTVFGWGPESMFVAFNPYYPPALANVEQRTASPDRAHQTVLDELATKGLLGLISYFFVMISFAVLAFRLMLYTKEWLWQVFAIACMSTVVSHFVEGMVGIPIVSTLTMLWVTMGITVVGGMLSGHYTLGKAEGPDWKEHAAEGRANGEQEPGSGEQQSEKPTTTTETSEATPRQNGEGGAKTREGDAKSRPRGRARSQKQQGRTGRGTTAGRARAGGAAARSAAPSRRSTAGASPEQTSLPALGAYVLLLIIAASLAWWGNISMVYADVRFHEGESIIARSGNTPEQQMASQIGGLTKYLEAIRNNVTEDFYYLNLGRNLMEIAEIKRASGIPIGEVERDIQVEDLLTLENATQVRDFVQQRSPMEMMNYAEAVLERALQLNPLNKDHYANLARLNNFWYNWTKDFSRLEQSVYWYEQVNTEVAPNDVALINEHAGIQMMMANLQSASGNPAEAQEHTERAAQLYRRSMVLDPNYGNVDFQLAEISWQQGRFAEAVEMYAHSVRRSPGSLDERLGAILPVLQDKPDLLRKLRDAYQVAAKESGQASHYALVGALSVQTNDLATATKAYSMAVGLEPDNLEYRQNYTIALSDTQQYDAALDEAQAALSLARKQQKPDDEAILQQVIALLQDKSE